MAVRNFMLLNRSDRAYLAERLRAVAARWQDEWLAEDADSVDVDWSDGEASTAVETRWRLGSSADGLTVAVAARDLMAILVGHSARTAEAVRSPVEGELEQAALDALIRALLSDVNPSGRKPAIQFESRQPDSETWDRRAGAVCARYRSGGAEIMVAIAPRATESLLQARWKGLKRGSGKLIPPSRALASQRIAIDVSAGAAELTLHELATLAVGDVITLDRRLAAPVAVNVSSGGMLCAGHLGTAGDRKAVQLTGINSNDEV